MLNFFWFEFILLFYFLVERATFYELKDKVKGVLGLENFV